MKERVSTKMQHNMDTESNQSKSVVVSDEWESYTLKFSVF